MAKGSEHPDADNANANANANAIAKVVNTSKSLALDMQVGRHAITSLATGLLSLCRGLRFQYSTTPSVARESYFKEASLRLAEKQATSKKNHSEAPFIDSQEPV